MCVGVREREREKEQVVQRFEWTRFAVAQCKVESELSWKGVKLLKRARGPRALTRFALASGGRDARIGNRCRPRARRNATRCSIASRELLTFALALLSARRSWRMAMFMFMDEERSSALNKNDSMSE